MCFQATASDQAAAPAVSASQTGAPAEPHMQDQQSQVGRNSSFVDHARRAEYGVTPAAAAESSALDVSALAETKMEFPEKGLHWTIVGHAVHIWDAIISATCKSLLLTAI